MNNKEIADYAVKEMQNLAEQFMDKLEFLVEVHDRGCDAEVPEICRKAFILETARSLTEGLAMFLEEAVNVKLHL
jgi:hypothetical protein